MVAAGWCTLTMRGVFNVQSASTINPPRVATDLFNRYLLPKVAMVLISAASLAGVYLTMHFHGGAFPDAFVRWVHLWAVATLAGGMMWWLFFVRPPAERDAMESVAAFALEQARRFRIAAGIALGLVLVTSPHLTRFARWTEDGTLAHGFLLVSIGSLAGMVAAAAFVLGTAPKAEHAFRKGRIGVAFTLTLAYIAATALLDAELTFPSWRWAWVLRVLHLAAFSLWLGGAIWNIFIAGPAALANLSLTVVTSAAAQLERFRWVVRVILPTLIVTGLAQALPYTGWSASSLLTTPIGRLITLKLALVVGLIGVFITCPLWRACSPIRGYCDLEDLQRPAPSKPTQSLDNRGKGCAGFAHIQKALNALVKGGTLEVLSSDPISWWELPAWLDKHGYTLLQKERRGKFLWRSYRFLIARDGGVTHR